MLLRFVVISGQKSDLLLQSFRSAINVNTTRSSFESALAIFATSVCEIGQQATLAEVIKETAKPRGSWVCQNGVLSFL
jgi:hypothetical protein